MIEGQSVILPFGFTDCSFFISKFSYMVIIRQIFVYYNVNIKAGINQKGK